MSNLIDKDSVIEIIKEYEVPINQTNIGTDDNEMLYEIIYKIKQLPNKEESESKSLPDYIDVWGAVGNENGGKVSCVDFYYKLRELFNDKSKSNDTKEEKDTMINMFVIPKKIKEGDLGKLTIYFQNGVFLKAEISFHKDDETYIH